MKTNRMFQRLWAGLLGLLLAISCAGSSAQGAELRSGSLTVCFGQEEAGFSGVTFRLYRVADLSETGKCTLSGAFADYPVTLEGLTASGWRALAQTLAAYVARDGLEHQRVGKTGPDGRVTFSGLMAGLYLVTGDRYVEGGTVYTPESLLVSLPGQTPSDTWDWEIEVHCKFDWEEQPQEAVERTVRKIWQDDGNLMSRPENIRVQLLENGQVVEAVMLDEENGWSYPWQGLEGGSRWQVVEAETPDGYTVSVSQEGTVFLLTNTWMDTVEPEQPPQLPQTGMLWWPVPILAAGGLLLLILGITTRRKSKGK